MSELPKGWAEATLAQIVFPDRPREQPIDHPHLPFVGMEHVEAHSMRLLGTVPSSELKSSAVHFQSGDVLYGRLRPYLNKVLLAGFEGLCSAEFIVFGKRAHVNSAWLAYFLSSSAFVSFSSHLNAGDRPRVDFDQIGTYELLLAPRPEQDRIVAEIEKQFTRLDAATAALKRVQANLKRYRASVLKAACEGRLVPTEAELARKEGRDYEPADKLLQCILRERRARWEADTLAKMQASGKPPKDDRWKQKYKEPSAPDTTDLPELPEGWCWTSLGQVVWSVKDGPHYSPKYVESGIPFITGGQVRPSGVDFDSAKFISPELHEELSRRCHPEKGDVLLTKGGTTGIARVNTYDIDFSVWVHVAVLKPVDSIEPFYLQHALNSPFCYAQSMRYTHGVGNQDLGLTRMVNIVMALPPLVEQSRINGELDRQFDSIDRLKENMEAGAAHWRRLRQSILSSAFTGQLVPQDPTDEPASVLLERIRAERGASSTQKPTRRSRKESAHA